jgi:hypothetical protein
VRDLKEDGEGFRTLNWEWKRCADDGMRDGSENERNEVAVSGMKDSNSLSWACRLISRYGGKFMHNLGEQSCCTLCLWRCNGAGRSIGVQCNLSIRILGPELLDFLIS